MTKYSWSNNPTLWKDSFNISLAIFAGLETILGISPDYILGKFNWIIKLLFALILFIIIVITIFIVKWDKAKKGVTVKIHGITVNVKQGDIFKANGWKIIAFNEYFDTIVDDKIIAHNTLNGIFIDNYIENIDDLQQSITSENDSSSLIKRQTKNNRWVYPLGRIIPYKDYMLLALTHFDEQNRAHLSQKDYEDCLRFMWKEICRVYANQPVFLPLLGSGITRFDGTPHKSKFDLLKCMLCTLRTSGENINQPITILLTEKVMQEINIYEIKGVK
ncbi:macro domain-containing protein [Treponema endosymbiont of Eucomonympha sp.]|uniref:macro domain-containing protein n=1 Tax=Treponema endosymbiont of Eucomonympha sp. TaxID=1580831 RepID=UPI0007518EF3|nr:macro domain-containing protein [Treponema endosymbiont of Eucomonympha sp.]